MQSPLSPTKTDHARGARASLCALYFFAFTSTYVWTIFPRTLETIGWSGAAVGILYSARKAVDIPSMWLWGALADRFNRKRIIQVQLGVGLLASIALATFLRQDQLMVASLLLFSASAASVFPIADSLTISKLGPDAYGFVRSFGSAGYAAMALTAAVVGISAQNYDAFSLFAIPFLLTIIIASLVFSFFIPNVDTAPRKSSVPLVAQNLSLLTQPGFVFLLVIGALHWACQTPLNLFLVALCEHHNLPTWSPGLGIFIGVSFEVLILAISKPLLKRLPSSIWLAISILTGVFRWYLMGHADTALSMMLLQALHGITFGAFFMAAIAMVISHVPEDQRSSGQAMFYLSVFGFGSIIGNLIAGPAFDSYGVVTIFEFASFAEFALLIPSVLFAWRTITR